MTEGRLAALKKHAEEKLAEADTRLGELVAANNADLQKLKETLQKTETANNSLQVCLFCAVV